MIVTHLIRYGHRLVDIYEYPIPLVKLFHKEIMRLQARERADRMEDTAIGASTVLSGSAHLEEVVDELRREG